jgi:hypothetical protein
LVKYKMGDYNNTTTGAACSYTNLQIYNQGPTKLSAASSSGVMAGSIVPQWGGVGYDALSHGAAPSCSGYFNVQSAYPSMAGGNCGTNFVHRGCQ